MISFLARQKFRFDLGVSFMMIVNLTLLSLSAADKIYSVTGLPARVSVPILVPVVVVAVWLVGYVLDRARFYDALKQEENLRNQMLRDALKRTPT